MRKIISIALLQFVWLIAPAQERQWFSEADIAGLNFPGAARNNAVSFVIGDTAYVGTGENADTTTTSFWKYVPVTKTWSRISDFPGYKRSGAVAFSLDGKGYVGTGKSGNTLFDDFYRYDPITDTWDAVANFGGGNRRNAVAFTVNGKAYVGTGQTTSGYASISSDLWEYDPNTNIWTQKQDVPDARTHAVAFSINGIGYIAAGFANTNFVNNICQYNPVNNSYTVSSLGPTGSFRREGIAFVLDGKAYIGLGDTKQNFVIYEPNKPIQVQSGTHFGSTSEDNRWGTIAFTIGDKAFVGLGVYTPDESDPSANIFKDDIWSFQYPTPDAPGALTVTDFTLTEATLHWSDRSNNEQGFAIERSVGDNLSFSLLASLPVDATLYEDNTLQSNQLYYYRVQAIGQSDNSPYTQSVAVNTYNAPNSLTATAQDATTVALSWHDNSAIETGFVVERSADGTIYYSLDTLDADLITYIDSQITAGIDYHYRVYALVDKINTNPTNTAIAGVLTNPTDLSAVAASRDTVWLAWHYAGHNASHYVIERKIEGGDFTNLIALAIEPNDTDVQYSDTDIEEGQQYTYRIKTTDAIRTSGYSASAQITTALHAPGTVTATTDSTGVIVGWIDISQHETHYVVHRSFADESGLVVVDTLEANTISFQDVAPLDSGDYRYIVYAIGEGTRSTGVESNTVTVVPNETTTEEEQPEEPTEEEETVTGIDDEVGRETAIVKAYPNPSSGLVSVYVGSERFAYVAVFNSQGRLVSEVQQAEQGSKAVVDVDLQHLSEGIYTLRIYTAREVVVKKIAKQ